MVSTLLPLFTGNGPLENQHEQLAYLTSVHLVELSPRQQ
jgi:hypothetical protein